MAPLGTSTHVYTRTHSAKFTADNLRTIFVRIIRQGGLSPTKLIDDWEMLAARWSIGWKVVTLGASRLSFSSREALLFRKGGISMLRTQGAGFQMICGRTSTT